MNTKELKIDPEFERLIPPLTEEEFKQLEENIVSENEIYTPLVVWNNIVIDGHNRYKILQKYPQIPYRIHERNFQNRYEVISWICNNQLGRRNLTAIQKTVLYGRKYDAEKMVHGGNTARERGRDGRFTSSSQIETLRSANEKTAERLARELGISKSTVIRAGKFVNGLDAAKEVAPEIETEIVTGKIKPSKDQVIAIAEAPIQDREVMVQALRAAEEERRKETQRKREERAAKRTMMEEIDRLAAEHGNMDRPPVSIESHLQSFALTAERFLGTCDSYFADVPELLTNETHRATVMVTGEKFIQYFTKIKENRYEPYIV